MTFPSSSGFFVRNAISVTLMLMASACGGLDPQAGSTSSGTKSGTGTKGKTTFKCHSTEGPGATVNVPAGEFIMGCNEEVDAQCGADEYPMRNVTVGAFEIQTTEVTQSQYAACVDDGGCSPPSCSWNCDTPKRPASCVNRAQSAEYCKWAGMRLPTEAEWEKAARGTDGRKYPWGNEEPSCELANMAGCGDGMTPAGSYPGGASPYGALDMAGNMVELVRDRYDAAYYASAPIQDPPGPENGSVFVGRGGGWKSDAYWQRASVRDWYDPEDAGGSLGFRCAH